jgi:hypothetical protein
VRPQRLPTVALGCLLAVAGAVMLASHVAGWTPLLLPSRATQHVPTETPEAESVVVIAAADAASCSTSARALLRHVRRPT